MTTGSLQAVVKHARKISGSADELTLTDGQLLESFLIHKNAATFNSLIRRHERLVRSVCRQVLPVEADVEDAVQAVFLVLALKASSIRRRNSLSSWLYGVAFKTAMSAHKAAARRRKHEQKPQTRFSVEPGAIVAGRELQAIVAEEVERLDEKYRAPFLLCCLEGRSKAEAARELGWKEGTVSGRLAKARKLLRSRLSRRGVALAAVLCLGALSQPAVASSKLAGLADTAVLVAEGTELNSVNIPSSVISLTRQVARALVVTSFKASAGLVLVGVLVLVAAGTCLSAMRSSWGRIGEPESQQAAPVAAPRVDALGDPLPEGAIARIGSIRFRADSTIGAVAYSPDGRLLAYGSGRVYVCEADSGKPVLEMPASKACGGAVTDLRFSPNSKTLVAGSSWSDTYSVIDVKSQSVLLTLPNSAKNLESRGRDWNYPCSAFIQDGKKLVVGGQDGALHLWSIPGGKELAVLKAEDQPVLSLSITSDGRIALAAQSDGGLHFWNLVEHKHLHKLDARLRYPHLTVIAPNGKLFATETGSGKVELRDCEGFKLSELRSEGEFVGLAFSPDNRAIRTADGNGVITTWDTASGTKISSFTCGEMANQAGSTINPAPAAWFNPDGTKMAWASGTLLKPWNLQTGQQISKASEFRNGLRWAGFAADEKSVRLGGEEGDLGIWDLSRQRLSSYTRFDELKNEVAYSASPDRRKMIAVSNRKDMIRKTLPTQGRVLSWDPTVDNRLHLLAGQVVPAWSATQSPDNRFLVTTEIDAEVRVYDANTGKKIRSFPGRTLEYTPTFSPDGKLLATHGGAGSIRIYEFATGRVLQELKANSLVSSIAFSHDGKLIASSHSSVPERLRNGPETANIICLWDVESGQELWRMKTGRHTTSLCFSPDGKSIASGGFDSSVHLWETATGLARHDFAGHQGGVWNVEFSADGKSILSASSDGTALIWKVFDRDRTSADPTNPDHFWLDFESDGKTAYRAMSALIATKTIPALLCSRLKPVARISAERVKKLLIDFANPDEAVRETANTELTRFIEQIGPAVREARENASDPDIRFRLASLLERDSVPWIRPDLLREERCIEVLEHIGNEAARRKLAELAAGAPQARLTRWAKGSLERLVKRKQ